MGTIDVAQAERIVENLVANAIRYTPAGTAIRVSARRCDQGVLLAVEDGGPGVPAELREQIFEPFRQGSEVVDHSPGVGIGLSLVARFADLHGGRAWVEETEGGGASFKVYLPDGRPQSKVLAGVSAVAGLDVVPARSGNGSAATGP